MEPTGEDDQGDDEPNLVGPRPDIVDRLHPADAGRLGLHLGEFIAARAGRVAIAKLLLPFLVDWS